MRTFARTNCCNSALRLLLLIAATCALAPVSRAATNVVRMGNYWFSPTNITINAGDSILWTNTSLTAHDSSGTNNSPGWESPLLAQRSTWALKFTNAGYYPYFCKFHVAAHPEQTGSVTVALSGNLAPTVAVTNPPNNAVLLAPASFSLQAAASDTDGTVSQVEFFNGSAPLGADTTSPYTASVNELAAGNYTFSAVATDNLGAKATNSVSIVVNSPPMAVALLSPVMTGSSFSFSFVSESGRSYAVQFNETLNSAGWQTLTNLAGNGSIILVVDPTASVQTRWYRISAQ